jgi:hypothetical protein
MIGQGEIHVENRERQQIAACLRLAAPPAEGQHEPYSRD